MDLLSGEWTGIKPMDADLLPTVKCCPSCRVPICGVARYGRPVHKAVADLQEKKYVKFGRAALETAKQVGLDRS